MAGVGGLHEKLKVVLKVQCKTCERMKKKKKKKRKTYETTAGKKKQKTKKKRLF